MNNPVAFAEGSPTLIFGLINAYPFSIVLGILISIMTVAFFWKRENWNWDIFMIGIIIIIPSSLIGARLGFIIERLIYNFDDPFPNSAWYAMWQGGLAIHGGVIMPGILVTGYVYYKKNEIDFWKAFSIILPSVLIGQVIGRWGNYGNHEIFGVITTRDTISWLGSYIADNMFIIAISDGIAAYRVPLFFYESLFNLIGYILIIWVFLYFGTFKPGVTGAMYLIWYGIVRTSMEPLRDEQYSFYTIIAALQITTGLILAIYLQWFNKTQYIVSKLNKVKIYNSKWWIESKKTKGFINE